MWDTVSSCSASSGVHVGKQDAEHLTIIGYELSLVLQQLMLQLL